MITAKEALAFVNSHAPIIGQVHTDEAKIKHLFIISEEVDRTGQVRTVTDIIQANDVGKFSLEAIREVLGY